MIYLTSCLHSKVLKIDISPSIDNQLKVEWRIESRNQLPGKLFTNS